MPGVADLTQRWGDVFHDTAEYGSAQRSDAAASVARKAQAQTAIRAALQGGNAAKAAAIQQAALQADVDERTGRGGGRVAALDEFQNRRVNDYLDQTRERGQANLESALKSPVRAVANGPGYYDSLLNPDFSQAFPYMTVHPVGGPMLTGRGGRGQTLGGGQTQGGPMPGNPYGISPEMVAANQPTLSMLDSRAQDAENATQTRVRRDQALRNTLPADLLDTYNGILKDRVFTPKEYEDFIQAAPETQYAQLRGRQAQTKNFRPGPTANGGGSITSDGVQQDFLGNGGPALNFGSGRGIDRPVPGQGPIDLPVIQRTGGGVRPSTTLAAPAPLTFASLGRTY